MSVDVRPATKPAVVSIMECERFLAAGISTRMSCKDCSFEHAYRGV